MKILLDATTLIAFGRVGELDLLLEFDGDPVVLPAVRREVTSEPASTNVGNFVQHEHVLTGERLPFSNEGPDEVVRPIVDRATETLGESEYSGDVELVTAVMHELDADGSDPAVISDDRRVRTVCRGLGATVTGTVGIVIRAVEERGMTSEEGKGLVRRIDGHGLHMTGELRETAYELIEEAANDG